MTAPEWLVPEVDVIARGLPGYHVGEILGRGGMGVVYRAEDRVLHRTVALKVLASFAAKDDGFRQRFAHECQVVANLDHPHVIPVYAAGQTEDLLYIAMRYVPGGHLGSLLASRGPLPLDRAVSVVAQIGGALDAAHALGLVHRDVKPANILVDDLGDAGLHCYLCDFGITKDLTGRGLHLTRTGQILGTIDYVAPEQVEGKVEAASDLYSLGCVFYECMSGAPPFRRDEKIATLFAHGNDPPPSVVAVRPEVPAAVDQVLAKALAKRPADRYGSCSEFAAALRSAARSSRPAAAAQPFAAPRPVAEDLAEADGPTIVGRARGPRRRWVAWAAFGLVVLAVVATLAVPALRNRVPFPNADEATLLQRLPPELRPGCGRGDAAGGEVVLRCTVPDVGAEIAVTRFAASGDLAVAYQAALDQSGLAPDSGDCAIGPGEHALPVTPPGRVVCFVRDGTPVIVWTDAERTTLFEAARPGDARALYEWWAGLTGVAIADFFPTADEQALLALVDATRCIRASNVADLPGAVAGVECVPSVEDAGAARVWYYAFADPAALRTAYDQRVQAAHPPAGATGCVRAGTPLPSGFLAADDWGAADALQGHVLCYTAESGDAVLEWTYDDLLVYAVARGSSGAGLRGWWDDAERPTVPTVR